MARAQDTAPQKIAIVFGTRPEAIKLFPLIHLLKGDPRFEPVVIVTGQHRGMLDQVLDIARIVPDHDLAVMQPGQTLDALTARLLTGIGETLDAETPDWVVVQGDTASAMCGALAAFYRKVPIAHVEAGLRSFNRSMPEEINRIVTDHVASFLFCPNTEAVGHLRREGVTEGVYEVGDVMYDCHLLFVELASEREGIHETLGLASTSGEQSYCLATIHRAENTDYPGRLDAIMRALQEIDAPVILPIHPRTRKAIESQRIVVGDNVIIAEPMSFLDLFALKVGAQVILTDSGGLQKEAYFCGVPCVTLREETEWNETTESGMNVIAGADTGRILDAFERMKKVHRGERSRLFGDGNAAGRMLDVLRGVFR